MISTDIKNIYMIAICGTAMGSLAAMLKSQGYQITGSDNPRVIKSLVLIAMFIPQ